MDRPRSRPHTRHTPPLPEGRALQRTRAVPMLEPLRRWLQRSAPGPFDGPTAQELTVLLGGAVLTPLALPFLWLALPFTEVLRGEPWYRWIAIFLIAPIVLPVASYFVLGQSALLPILRRRRARVQTLRHADRAVQVLLHEAFVERLH